MHGSFSIWIPSEAGRFRRGLLRWYRAKARYFPWRDRPEPYRVWLAEVMAQQTRLSTVVGYFERFLARFPDIETLAQVPIQDVLAAWTGLGYYSRARNLHRAAQVLVEHHGGLFPRDVEGLRTLPGVGEYTARAIASIAFGQRVAVVDGNVHRVLARLWDIRQSIGDPGVKRDLQECADALVPASAPGDYNQALMELGEVICIPRVPRCPVCPVRRACQALAHDTVAERPVKPSRRSPRPVNVLAAVLQSPDTSEVLLVQHPLRGLFGGLWMIPALVETTEKGTGSAVARLQAFVQERLGIRVTLIDLGIRFQHQLTHRTLRVRLFGGVLGGVAAKQLQPIGFPDVRWVRKETDWSRLGLSRLTLKVLVQIGWEI